MSVEVDLVECWILLYTCENIEFEAVTVFIELFSIILIRMNLNIYLRCILKGEERDYNKNKKKITVRFTMNIFMFVQFLNWAQVNWLLLVCIKQNVQ